MKTEDHYPGQYIFRQMVKAKLYIDANYSTRISLDHMAREAHFSKFHFIRLFREIYCKTPNQYLSHVRIEKAKELLKYGARTATVCHAVGYESLSSFKELFKKKTSFTPAEFREKHRVRQEEVKLTPSKFLPHCFTKL